MRLVAVICALIFLSSCEKAEDQMPNVFVQFPFTELEFQISHKDNVWLKDGHGIAGLMIIRTSSNQYKAFDRCSTVNPEKKCAVIPDGAYTATDPCSGAMFSLIDGAPAKKPAKRYLKEYTVYVSGQNMVVRN